MTRFKKAQGTSAPLARPKHPVARFGRNRPGQRTHALGARCLGSVLALGSSRLGSQRSVNNPKYVQSTAVFDRMVSRPRWFVPAVSQISPNKNWRTRYGCTAPYCSYCACSNSEHIKCERISEKRSSLFSFSTFNRRVDRQFFRSGLCSIACLLSRCVCLSLYGFVCCHASCVCARVSHASVWAKSHISLTCRSLTTFMGCFSISPLRMNVIYPPAGSDSGYQRKGSRA